jgi:hypothetical protein
MVWPPEGGWQHGLQGRPWRPGGNHAATAIFAAISRLTRCTVPLPTPTIAATFSMPFPVLRWLLLAFSTSGNTLGRPSFLPAGAHDLIRQGPCCGASFLSCSPKTDAI